MPIVALQLDKSQLFQGAREEHANVYTLNSGVDFNDDWSAVAQKLWDLERAISHSSIRGESYTVWDLEGTQLERVIIDSGPVTGVGLLNNAPYYRECAIHIRFPISRSPVLRRRRWLSKWLHTGCIPQNSEVAVNTGEQVISTTMKNAIQTVYIEPLLSNNGIQTGVVFCDATGERPSSGQVQDYLEHRQFHRG